MDRTPGLLVLKPWLSQSMPQNIRGLTIGGTSLHGPLLRNNSHESGLQTVQQIKIRGSPQINLQPKGVKETPALQIRFGGSMRDFLQNGGPMFGGQRETKDAMVTGPFLEKHPHVNLYLGVRFAKLASCW